MSINIYKGFTVFFYFFVFPIVQAQEQPPVINYSPNIYSADNQNWMISQAPDRTIYVANNIGLLSFNGAQWDLYPSPNETILRGVKVIGEKVYTGAYMDFGVWEKKATGGLEYTSLSQQKGVPMIEDEHIWNIVEYKRYVLFQSLDRIYIYNSESEQLQIITPNQKVMRLFMVDDELFFQVKGGSLFRIENGEATLFIKDAMLNDTRLINLYRIDDQLVGVTATKGFYVIDTSGISIWDTIDAAISTNINVYSSIIRKNGSIVLGTIENGIIQISKNGELEYKIKKGSGLGNNTALSLLEDHDQNLWVGLDAGIDCVNTQSPFKQFVDLSGDLGTIYTSAVFDGYLYLGTNQGLFYKEENSTAAFNRMKGTQGQVWDLTIINGQLFCGHNNGTYLIKGVTQELIGKREGTWGIREIPGNEHLLLQGNYDGLYVLEKSGNSWQIRNKIDDFVNSSKHFEFIDATTILVNHEYKGVFQIKTDLDHTRAIEVFKHKDVGIGEHSSLSKLGEEIFYAKKDGVYTYDRGQGAFKKDEKLSTIFTKDNFITGKLISDQERLWAFVSDAVIAITKDKLDGSYGTKKFLIPSSLRKTVDGYESFVRFRESEYLLGTSNGYILADIENQSTQQYQVLLNKVTIHDLGGLSELVSLDEDGSFKSKSNNIRFAYSVPMYNKFLIPEYKTSLDGFYDEWSDWNTVSNVSFENLSYGSYTFKVKSRVGGLESSNIETYSFSIARPWFLSNLAIGTYVILTILLFTGLNWFYKRYYRRQQEQLLERSQRDLQLKALESEKQIVELNNANLKQDIDARNRELAVSTMNMLNKSKTLNTIKTALLKAKKIEDVTSIIEIVDSTIENEEDWNFFEEAFNHADKDFFRKVKEKHPSLTANDLKLCVYLRLNMSSKEIAPLLNISPRSVEIKRYRLRKKLDLSREINLNDYFIDL